MKKFILIFTIIACVMPCVSHGAVTIKKAPAVSSKKSESGLTASSLVPTVLGMVNSIQALKQQQQQLTAECAPTSDEISIVNDLVKEWAKTGTTTANSAVSGLGYTECTGAYEAMMQNMDSNESCYEIFKSEADKGMVWYGFPKASYGKKCDVGTNKNCETISNVYVILEKIPFSFEEDLTKSELRKVNKLQEKAARCAPDKLNAAKRELAGNFVTQTLSGVGQTTGAASTESIIQSVSSMGGSGSFGNAMLPMSMMLMQTMDK